MRSEMTSRTSSSNKSCSSGPVMSAFRRSRSPSGRYSPDSYSNTTPFNGGGGAAASKSTFYSSTSSSFFHRSTSPTRVNLQGFAPINPTPSVRMSIVDNRSMAVTSSPRRSMASMTSAPPRRSVKKTCLCSPTTHPGSFRCSLHKNLPPANPSPPPMAYSLKNLTIQRSAMKNSLVRIGTVEGDLVKRALAALIRPSSHQIKRRGDFQQKPSRLSVMSTAEDHHHPQSPTN